MKYIPDAMKFGTQSRSSSLIINMIFKIVGLDLKLKTWSQNCNVPNFYEIWHPEQTEHANYECSTLNWWSWPKIIDLGKFGLNTEICSDFSEIWHSQKIEHAYYEYNTHQCLKCWHDYRVRIIVWIIIVCIIVPCS